MRRLAVFLLVSGFLVGVSFSEQICCVPLPDMVKQSDLIARVLVRKTGYRKFKYLAADTLFDMVNALGNLTPRLRRPLFRGLSNAGLTNAGDGYRRIAEGEVVELVKSHRSIRTVDLPFDTGYACPNFGFRPGEECLVFAEIAADGTFEVLYVGYGKFPIRGEQIYWPYPSMENAPASQGYSEVVGEIRQEMSRQKRASAAVGGR